MTNIREIKTKASKEWLAFQDATEMMELRKANKSLRLNQEEWRKPEQDWIIIKSCALEENGKKMGAARILTIDENGRITNAWSITWERFLPQVATDLEAIRCALILAQQQG